MPDGNAKHSPAGLRNTLFAKEIVRSGPNKGTSMSFLAELWRFIRVRKKFWLLPILAMAVVFGGLIVLTQGSAVAPFIYTLF